jgi:hypothetical protein
MYIKVCCWKKSCSTLSPANRKPTLPFSFPKNNPLKFESNAGRPVFCGLRWRSKILSTPSTLVQVPPPPDFKTLLPYSDYDKRFQPSIRVKPLIMSIFKKSPKVPEIVKFTL